MIIVIDKPGRLCNQLWAYSPFITFSVKNRIPLRILDFYDYAHLFNKVNKNEYVKFGIFGNKLIDRFLRILIRIIRKLSLHFDLSKINIFSFNQWDNENWRPILENKKNIIFLYAWDHPKDIESLRVYKGVIINMFRPKEIYIKRAAEFVKEIRASCNVLVGVHIRRTDYKYFRKGGYWFSDDIYLGRMMDIEKQFIEKGLDKVCFLLCSDADICLEKYLKVNAKMLKERSDIEDLYALSICDYILGPPSTFSMWASFYGGVPLRFIKHSNDKIFLREFSRIISQDVFENGTKFEHEVPE